MPKPLSAKRSEALQDLQKRKAEFASLQAEHERVMGQMGMYNLIFDKSKSAPVLLAALGLSESSFYRFRDCFLDEQGRIAVYTRGGGHNRGAGQQLQEANRGHSQYLFDRDDDFDNTYATFYFRVPEAAVASLVGVQPELNRDTAWQTLIEALQVKERNK